MKFYILDGGHLGPYNKSSFILGRGKGKKIILPVWQAYIEHPKAKILIDTGINPQTDMLPGYGRGVHQNEDQRIENQLGQIGVNPEEIDIVINTHLHYDHTAANHLFKQAVFIVQKAEMRYAYAPEWYEASYYQPISHFDIPDLNYKLIEGDFEVAEGVQILFTPGHTPGTQSVLIRTENPGPFLIAGDAAYLQENIDDFIINKIANRPSQCWDSLIRIVRIGEQSGATVIPGHDETFYKTLKKAPLYYE